MPTVCMQCAMRALLNDETPPTFAETPEEHIAREHPDPEQTTHERLDLERRLLEKLQSGG